MNMFKKIDKEKLASLLYPLFFGVFVIILWQTETLHLIMGADTFTLPVPMRIIVL
jgi:NitT/TauT family transport system permease protein